MKISSFILFYAEKWNLNCATSLAFQNSASSLSTLH